MHYLSLIGRILFALLFIIQGLGHFSEKAAQHALTRGVPQALVPIAGIIALLGGLSILFNYKLRWGAWLIVLFLVPTTLMMHPFWNAADLYSSTMEQLCFFKNIALIGSALLIVYSSKR